MSNRKRHTYALDTASNHRYDVYQNQSRCIPVHRASGSRIVTHVDSLEKRCVFNIRWSYTSSASNAPHVKLSGIGCRRNCVSGAADRNDCHSCFDWFHVENEWPPSLATFFCAVLMHTSWTSLRSTAGCEQIICKWDNAYVFFIPVCSFLATQNRSSLPVSNNLVCLFHG